MELAVLASRDESTNIGYSECSRCCQLIVSQHNLRVARAASTKRGGPGLRVPLDATVAATLSCTVCLDRATATDGRKETERDSRRIGSAALSHVVRRVGLPLRAWRRPVGGQRCVEFRRACMLQLWPRRSFSRG